MLPRRLRAHETDGLALRRSVAGEIVGTLEYVAPEQITGDAMDERSDVYSLGCVVYECLTGQSPFPRATDVALLWAHVHEEPTPPSQARPDLPKGARYRPDTRARKGAGSQVPVGRRAPRGDPLGAPARRHGSRRCLACALAATWGSPQSSHFSWSQPSLAFILTRDSGGLSSVSPNSVGVIDPGSNKLVADVPVGIDPQAIATGLGGVWVTNVEDETVSRIDPTDTTARDATITVDGYPSDLAVGGGTVWVALGALAEFQRINPEQNEATTRPPHSATTRPAARRARASHSA